MQEYPILGIGIILGLLIVNGLASAAETAFEQPLSVIVKKRAAEGDKRAKRVAAICDRRKRCTTVLDLLRTVSVFLCGITYAELVKDVVIPGFRTFFAEYKPMQVYVWGCLVLLTLAGVWLVELISI